MGWFGWWSQRLIIEFYEPQFMGSKMGAHFQRFWVLPFFTQFVQQPHHPGQLFGFHRSSFHQLPWYKFWPVSCQRAGSWFRNHCHRPVWFRLRHRSKLDSIWQEFSWKLLQCISGGPWRKSPLLSCRRGIMSCKEPLWTFALTFLKNYYKLISELFDY